MGRNPHRRNSAREGDKRPVGPTHSDKADERKEPLWRKPLAWLGGIATVVIGGVLVSVLSVQAERITSVPTPVQTQAKHSHPAKHPHPDPARPTTDNQSQRPPKSLPPRNLPKSSPLRILSEDPINLIELGVWTFPERMILSSNRLAKLNSSFVDSRSPAGIADYLSPLGGYAQSIDMQIVVQNVRSHSIQILNMNVIKNCRAPLTGTVFFAPGQAEVEDIQMGFNLDSVDTGAKVVNGVPTVSPSDPNYFSKYTVVIGPGKRQVFNIRTVTNKWACSFLYSATILDGTRKVYQEIGDGERPFRISSLATGTQQQPFSGYAVAYVGGPTNTGTVGPYIRVNPKTYR